MNGPAIHRDETKRRRTKHVIAFAIIIIALSFASEFNIRIPAAELSGPTIVILLFVYGAWILFLAWPNAPLEPELIREL
jgi:hypothetical protein